MKIKNLTKYPNLNNYFSTYIKNNNHTWRNFPIVLRWIDKNEDLESALQIIEKKVKYLYSKNAAKKLNEWFDTKSVFGEVRIYAERYILDYLRSKNSTLVDRFSGGGVDAVFNNNVGIEVTTFSEAEVSWVLQERLLMYIWFFDIKLRNSFEIIYPLENLKAFIYKPDSILNEVEKVGEEIMYLNTSNKRVIRRNNYVLTKGRRGFSYISWSFPSEYRNLVDDLTTSVFSKLNDRQKKKQLSEFAENIVFICLNFIPDISYYPDKTTFLKELANPKRYIQESLEFKNKILEILPQNVSGVCFFEYSIDREMPFNKLRLFSSKQAKEAINI